ncbi:hypothetical protein [Kineosporia succinea]|uniref:Uncharacterized protein n=1 Tax=Kineosporia succinea TaxID=84632 RepID=A0ABT9P7L2_9ACTN|nr:hypothetical protein [Kineosporia succinea]MDP9828035.1 hypothetical protein [Kineosporia succinea]
MAWRMAKSLDKLLAEINGRSPQRSKDSDGGIGDAAHASRESDHNPWVQDAGIGVVTARDFTDDPGAGFDASSFAAWLRARCKAGTETRVKYIISDRRICSGTRENWSWRPYSGPNSHTKHVHVSVLASKGRYDDGRSWGWQSATPGKETIDMADTKIDGKQLFTEGMLAQTKLTPADAAEMTMPDIPRKADAEVSLLYILKWGGPGLFRLYKLLREVRTLVASTNAQQAEILKILRARE